MPPEMKNKTNRLFQKLILGALLGTFFGTCAALILDISITSFLLNLDGSRQMGTLVDFDATAKAVSIQSGSGAPMRLDFSAFKIVRFTRGMPLVKSPQQNAAAGSADAGKGQKLILQFIDAEQMPMEVVGVVEQHAGLFLYASSFWQDIMCSFVPACALQK